MDVGIAETTDEIERFAHLGIVLLILPAYFLGRWIRICNAVSDHDDRVAEFASILPRVLNDPLASTLFAIASAAAAGAVGLNRLIGVRRGLFAATLGRNMSVLTTLQPVTVAALALVGWDVGRKSSRDSELLELIPSRALGARLEGLLSRDVACGSVPKHFFK